MGRGFATNENCIYSICVFRAGILVFLPNSSGDFERYPESIFKHVYNITLSYHYFHVAASGVWCSAQVPHK